MNRNRFSEVCRAMSDAGFGRPAKMGGDHGDEAATWIRRGSSITVSCLYDGRIRYCITKPSAWTDASDASEVAKAWISESEDDQ